MRQWTKFVDETLHPVNGAVIWGLLLLKELRQQDPDEVRAMIRRHPDSRRVNRQLQIFEQGFAAPVVGAGLQVFVETIEKMDAVLAESPYLAGDTVTLADLALLPYATEVMNYGIHELADNRPHLHRWFERMTARASYDKAITATLPAEQWESIRKRGLAAWEVMRQTVAP